MTAESASPRVTSTPFKPDGGFNPMGLAKLLSGMIIVGAVLGFVAYFISQFFWFIVLFPLLIGLGLGAVGKAMVRSGRIRNPWIGALAGLVGGVFAMTAMHYFSYRHYQKAILAEFPAAAEIVNWSADEREKYIASAVAEGDDADETRYALDAMSSFIGYMNLQAQAGVEISKSGTKGINLGYYGSYIYWLIEVAVVAIMTLVILRKEAANPFCVACDEWKSSARLGGFSDPTTAGQSLAEGDVQKLATAGPTALVAPSSLLAHVCPRCNGEQSTADLKLVVNTVDGKGNVSEQVAQFVRWPAHALPAVAALFTAPPPEAAPAQSST